MINRSPFRWSVFTLALLASGVSAYAQETTTFELNDVENDVADVASQTEELERQVAPGVGFIQNDDAVNRFQEYLYFYMLEDWAKATEGFFVLVTTGALVDTGMHRDAEWYLAEGMLKMGYTRNAEAGFDTIAYDENHPFREDAVRRLLEIFATTHQTDRFNDLYEREIVRGRVQPSALITYSIAKGFYQQQDYTKAKAYMSDVEPGSEHFAKSRYYLGAMLVLEPSDDNLRAAADLFREVMELSIDSDEARLVRDLSVMALARIHYELGEFDAAADLYNQVGGDSLYLADALYEIVWTFIKDEEYQSALNAVEIFLIAFSEHEYSAQLRLLEGRLHYREIEYDSALTSFERVISEYTPVQRQFHELATSVASPLDYFDKVRRVRDGQRVGESDLPAYAIAMMAADEALDRAIGLHENLDEQDHIVRVSEALIEELEPIIGGGNGIGGAQRIRYDIIISMSRTIQEELEALALEQGWILGLRPDVEAELADYQGRHRALAELAGLTEREIQRIRRDLDEWNGEVQRLQAELRQIDVDRTDAERELDSFASMFNTLDADFYRDQQRLQDHIQSMAVRRVEVESRLDELKSESAVTEINAELNAKAAFMSSELARQVEELRNDQVRYRQMLKVSKVDGMENRFDEVYSLIGTTRSRLALMRDRLNDAEASEMERIRDRFRYEVGEVSGQRRDLTGARGDVQEVAAELTRAGFGRLEGFFSESLLSADMGIVDVYWAQKVEVADRAETVTEERNRLLGDLERRFSMLRQKLDQ